MSTLTYMKYLILLFIYPFFMQNLAQADVTKPQSMYVYDSDNAVTGTTAERDAVLTFAKANALGTLYLSSDQFFIYPSKQPKLTEFLAAANVQGIKVVLLLGSYEWCYTENHAIALNRTIAATTFIAAATVKPIGIQFDVEPHATAKWTTDLQGTANQYLDFVGKIVAQVGAAVPVQFTTANFYKNKLIKRGSVTRPFSELILDSIPSSYSILIMNYRDDVGYYKVSKDSTGKVTKQFYSNKVVGTLL